MLEKDLQLNKQVAYGMQMQPGNGGIPSTGVVADEIKNSVDNSYLSNRIKQSEENSALLPAATLATWYGISQGMDVFNKKCNLEYEKTPMGKFGALGDRFTNWIKNGKVGKSSFGQGVAKAYTATTNALSKLLNRSAMYRAFRDTPTEPTNKFVLPQAKGLLGWVSQDTDQILEAFIKPAKSPFQLEQYGADKQFIKNLKQAMKAPGVDKVALLKKAELELLGVPQAQIDKYIQNGKILSPGRVEVLLRNAKIEKLGFTPQEYKKISKNFLENSDKVLAALEKAAKNNGDMFISRWRSDGFLGKIQNHLLGRKVGLRELYNKYLTTLGAKNPKHTSALGKGMAKALGLFMEGTTNRFAGGKFAVLMQAICFGDMIVNTIKAPKGEKGKTFAERFTNDFAYFLCAPFGLQLFHRIAGAGMYAGMTKDEVAQWRADLKDLNKRILSGQLSKKGDYINETEDLMNRLRAGRKNIISKTLGRLAEIADVGLEQIRGYHKKPMKAGFLGAIKDFFVNPKYYLKNLAGYPMRIVLIMGLLMPPLAKGATKIAHLIFGRPTHSVLDEDEETEEEKQKAEMERLLQELEVQRRAQAQAANEPGHSTNLLDKYRDKQTQAAVAQAQELANQQAGGTNPAGTTTQQAGVTVAQPQGTPAQQTPLAEQPKDNYTYVPSPAPFVPTAQNNSGNYSYVPSPNPFVQGPIDTSKADLALQKADAAEKLARQTLSMG